MKRTIIALALGLASSLTTAATVDLLCHPTERDTKRLRPLHLEFPDNFDVPPYVKMDGSPQREAVASVSKDDYFLLWTTLDNNLWQATISRYTGRMDLNVSVCSRDKCTGELYNYVLQCEKTPARKL